MTDLLTKLVIFKTVGILILASQVHAKDLNTEDLFETPPESHTGWQKRVLGTSRNPAHHKMETTLLIKLPGASSFKVTVPYNPYGAKVIMENRYPNAQFITVISSKYKSTGIEMRNDGVYNYTVKEP